MIKIKGVGLIETLIIILFVAITVLALVRFQHTLSYNTGLAQQQSDASLLAISKIESLRNFQVLNTTAGYTAYSDIASGSSTSTVNGTSYTTTWTVTTNTSPDYKTINVTVAWTDRFSTARSIQLISQVAGVDPSRATTVK